MTDLVNANLEAGAPGDGAGHAMAALEDRAVHVAARLAEVANPKRLLILCHLARKDADADAADGDAASGKAMAGEASVGELQSVVGLSQSALSQHLARLRAAGMVATRRESQTIHYRLANDETRALMRALYATFCAEQELAAVPLGRGVCRGSP